MLNGYSHFAQLAESLQWDETELDLTEDVEAWPQLTEDESTHVLGLIAGFCIGETAVASELGSFQVAATDDTMATTFKAQARDEARHARFFDRVAREVAQVPGDNVPERLEALRSRTSSDIVDLFETRLPEVARELADDHGRLTNAVGLYHMTLEGVVLLAGQHAMMETLDHLSAKLPGTRKGMELVLRDERWHIGFGSRVIQGANILDDEMEQILVQGEKASTAWGDLISSAAIDKAAQLHRRRLKAVGIKFW